MRGLGIFRCSSLTAFLDCPRRAMADRVYTRFGEKWGLRSDMGINISALMGTALHRVYEGSAEGRRGADWLNSVLETEGGQWSGVHYDKDTPDMQTAASQLRRMAEELERVEPAFIADDFLREKELKCDLEIDGSELTLSGRPDRVDVNMSVHDLKTSAAPIQGPAKHAAQMGGYMKLVEDSGMGRSEGAILHYVSRGSITKNQPEIKSMGVSRETAMGACFLGLRAAVRATKDYEAGGPTAVAANPSSMLCGKKFCRAHGTDFCPVTKKI